MESTENTNAPRITFGKKLGYCVGGATDTLAYDFVAAFLLFFLTDFAGVNPIFAGSILTIGVLWDMITDPIIGNLADKTRTRFGKKRTWLLIAIIPLFISYALLFTKMDALGGAGRNAYFLIMTLLFWTAYTCFSIPYYSMGASMTPSNDERTRMRMLAMIIQYVGVFFSTVAPPMFASFFMKAGMDNYHAWHYVGLLEAVLCVIILIIVFLSTKDVEIDFETEEEAPEKKSNFFKDAAAVLQIKPYLIMILSSLMFRVGYCFFLTTMIYFLLYTVGLSEMQMTGCTSIITFGGIIVIAILMKAIEKVEKAKLYVVLLLFSAIGMIIFNFLPVKTLGMACLMCVVYVIGSSAYWSINIPMMYDSIEVDEFQSGMRREGTMLSFYLFMQKGGYAIAASVVGVVLAKSGYDETLGTANPESVLSAIQAMTCLATGIFFAISALLIILYPLKKDVYDKLYVQLENKRAGREYNTDGFEKVLNKKHIKPSTALNEGDINE